MALKTCRCCCSTMRLEKAAKIIGIVFTIMYALAMVMNAVQLCQLDADHDQLLLELTELFPHQDVQQLFQHSRTTVVVRLCAAIVFTLFSAVLVAGVYRSIKQLVLMFVVFNVLYLAVYTISTFYAFYDPSIFIDEVTIIRLRKQDVDIAKAVIYASLAFALAISAFLWYLAAVVYSYYKEMERCSPTTEHRQLF